MSLEGFNIRLWIADMYEEREGVRGVIRQSAPAVARYIRDTIRKRIPPGNTSSSGMSNRFPGYAATGRMKNTIVASPITESAGRRSNIRVGVARNATRLDHIKLHVHEYGKVIRPRRAPYLVFRNEEGRLIFTRRVRIRAKRFFRSGWDEAERNYMRIVVQEIRKRTSRRYGVTTRRGR